jgi:hypothetical protein
MDLVVAGLQGLGLALAIGTVAGALGGAYETGRAQFALWVAAAIGGAYAFGASLEPEGHPAWPGWPPGAIAAILASIPAADVIAGAVERSGGEAPSSALLAIVVLGSAGVAAVSLLFGPLSLIYAGGLAWVGWQRRGRGERKYAGLRILR